MRMRCRPNSEKKEYYFNRGIHVTSAWEDFNIFKSWAETHGYSPDLELDRKDNDLGYSPENCRWVTKAVQMQNTRLIHSSNTSGYRGVTWRKARQKFVARCGYNGSMTTIGHYFTAIQAAKVYNDFVTALNLNHPLNILPETIHEEVPSEQ